MPTIKNVWVNAELVPADLNVIFGVRWGGGGGGGGSYCKILLVNFGDERTE